MAENKLFDSGIQVTGSFSAAGAFPVDGKFVVDTIAQRDDHVTQNRAYDGMLVYVKEDKKTYQYNQEEDLWEQFGANPENPEFTESVNMGRKEGTEVGKNSVALGTNVSAIGDNGVAMGNATISGCKGYYYKAVDVTHKKIYLSTTQQLPTIVTAEGSLRDETIDAAAAGYAVGDEFCIINDYHYIYPAKITSIDKNIIGYDNAIGFTTIAGSMSGAGPHDYSFYVPTKPLVGCAVLHTEGFSIGAQSMASGRRGVASGFKTVVAGSGGVAEGSQSVAGYVAHAEGLKTRALGRYSHAEGDTTEATGERAHSEGQYSKAKNFCSHAEGIRSEAANTGAHAEGVDTKATGQYSHAQNNTTTAQGENSHAEGYNTKALGGTSHAEGHTTEAKYCAHAEGGETKAHGNYSHTEGYSTYTKGSSSHAEGRYTHSHGNYSHTEGEASNKLNAVITDESVLTNYDTVKASWDATKFSYGFGVASHTEGKDNISWGDRAHSEGYSTIAKGENAHSEGYNTRAIGSHSHAEGHTTEAGYCGHAEGGGTKATGTYAHAEGANTEASGNYSHSEGKDTIAASAYQHVQGRYNVKDASGKYVHIVGWGSSDSARANIHTLDTAGNAWFKGDVEANGVSLADVSKIAEDADSAASGLKKYSGVIDVIDVYNISDPDERAIYRMPLYYLIIDGKFHDYATVKIREWAQLPSEPGEPAAKDFVNSRGDTVDYYTVYLNLTDEKYYVYYNSEWSELSSVASSLFGENYSFAGTYTNASEIPTTNSVAILKTSALYTLAYGRVTRVISNRATSYFGESFNSIDNKATGSFSHAEGVRATASGYAAHAEGDGTTASGPESHTEGGGTEARGWCSHAEGYFTVAAGSRQHVQGRYNIIDTQDKYAHIVGNGTSEDERSNCHTLDWEGNAWFAKSISIGGAKLEFDFSSKRLIFDIN